VSEIDVMKDILVVAPDTMTGGRWSGWQSITDSRPRGSVSTIEPVTIQAAGLATRPEPLHDKGTSA
jgi:hypothetical protein